MQDIIKHIEYKGEQLPLVYNLNVMEQIQEQYGTLQKWADLVSKDEPKIKDIKFGIMAMINEGIDIENEARSDKKAFINEKQIGRILTEIGLENTIQNVVDLQVKSTEVEQSKNA